LQWHGEMQCDHECRSPSHSHLQSQPISHGKPGRQCRRGRDGYQQSSRDQLPAATRRCMPGLFPSGNFGAVNGFCWIGFSFCRLEWRMQWDVYVYPDDECRPECRSGFQRSTDDHGGLFRERQRHRGEQAHRHQLSDTMLGGISFGNRREFDCDRSFWLRLRWMDWALFGHEFLFVQRDERSIRRCGF
jgi:hypothetical protein